MHLKPEFFSFTMFWFNCVLANALLTFISKQHVTNHDSASSNETNSVTTNFFTTTSILSEHRETCFSNAILKSSLTPLLTPRVTVRILNKTPKTIIKKAAQLHANTQNNSN